jgi:hypothetical protein
MYDPVLGRFIQRDPVRQEEDEKPTSGDGYKDGMSLYCGYFVPNLVDPEGTTCGSWFIRGVMIQTNNFGSIPGFRVGFENRGNCACKGKINIVQAIDDGSGPHIDNKAMSDINQETPGGIPLPAYGGKTIGNGDVLDSPGWRPFFNNWHWKWSKRIYHITDCAVCSCGSSRQILGCVHFDYDASTKTVSVPGAGPHFSGSTMDGSYIDSSPPDQMFNQAWKTWKDEAGD